MGLNLSPLYAIIDRETVDARGVSLLEFAEGLRDAGVQLLQYRDKKNSPQEVLRAGRAIADVFAGKDATLILNDRADLAALLGWGVHLGQGDLPVEAARRLVGDAVIGVSTHNSEQAALADRTGANYLAVGPVFATSTKLNAAPVVGVEGVHRARSCTGKPLVGIGGIKSENASSVWKAGADSVAVISALIPKDGIGSVQEAVSAFLNKR